MKLTFIGTGSAFTTDGNYQSNFFVEAGGERLLIDCGSDARHALKDLGYSYKDIDSVYISHLHADHIGGLEWLGFTRKFDPTTELAHLYLSSNLRDSLWNTSLKGGMGSLEGSEADLNTFFHVHSVPTNGFFIWNGLKFQLVQSIHVMNGFQYNPAYGLLFTINGKKVFFTSDIQFVPSQYRMFYEVADIIFHDTETAPFLSGVHPHYSDLCRLPEELKAKMWLYHYQPGQLPDAVSDGFRGFVQKGQTFDFSDESSL